MEQPLKQFVAYYRVSSKRQRDEGVSIDAQKKIILDYALRHNFQVIKEFEIDESAKQAGRVAFQEMIGHIKQNPKISGILCEKIDRLMRGNLKDRVIIEDLVNEQGKEVHFVKEGLVISKDSKSFQKLQFDIQNGFARFFLNNLSDEVKKAYDVLVDDGYYPHVPPLGYISKLDKHIALVDSEVAPFIKRTFELCATGEYSEKKISHVLYLEGFRSRKGNKVGKSSIGKILHENFYYGSYKWKDKIYRGNHEPIISKDLFDKVQQVLSPKMKRGYKHDFAFTGLMRCGECGNGITAELQKGHVYYHCTKPRGAKKCSQKYIREEKITEQLQQVIKAVSLDIQKIQAIKQIMKESHSEEEEYLQQSLESLNERYMSAISKLGRLLDAYLDNSIKKEVYDSKSVELNLEIETTNSEINKFKNADKAYFQEIEGLLTFCNEAPALFKNSRPELQRELLRFVVSNLILKDGMIEFSLKMPFNIVALYSKNENWQG